MLYFGSTNEDQPDYEVVTFGLPAQVWTGKNKLFLRVLAELAN